MPPHAANSARRATTCPSSDTTAEASDCCSLKCLLMQQTLHDMP
eukprot:CAMPEP_0203716976 /NCGR_PEP_ID=MMETSP0092-20131115/1558_1 /ASSEMBLY_ACC=CAM_ASM_001090 /TAXON_ID=426623 /ORGANISM="Chaetoceros affinis, Strain CCMP159" /LENGTH=43 /DNA_ID= /DNA_START= /DNA_END= /DNA_ORIENTATION=